MVMHKRSSTRLFRARPTSQLPAPSEALCAASEAPFEGLALSFMIVIAFYGAAEVPKLISNLALMKLVGLSEPLTM